MAQTKSFRRLVQRHVRADPKFAEALRREGVDAMLSGDLEIGKTILRVSGLGLKRHAAHPKQRG
jgi:hypothetical protein